MDESKDIMLLVNEAKETLKASFFVPLQNPIQNPKNSF